MKAKYESSHIDTIEISIPAKPEFLKIFRAALSSVCEVRGFCKDDLNNVILAVDESCSNIIRHAYGGPTEKPIKAKIYICSEFFRTVLPKIPSKNPPKVFPEFFRRLFPTISKWKK